MLSSHRCAVCGAKLTLIVGWLAKADLPYRNDYAHQVRDDSHQARPLMLAP